MRILQILKIIEKLLVILLTYLGLDYSDVAVYNDETYIDTFYFFYAQFGYMTGLTLDGFVYMACAYLS